MNKVPPIYEVVMRKKIQELEGSSQFYSALDISREMNVDGNAENFYGLKKKNKGWIRRYRRKRFKEEEWGITKEVEQEEV